MNPYKILLILVGPPGCGKSFYCKNILESDYFRISQDEMGKAKHLEEFNKALERGEPKIVVDRMNFNKAQRAKYAQPAYEKGYTVIGVEFRWDRNICLKRIAKRENHPTLKSDKAEQVINFFQSNYEAFRPEEEKIAWTQTVEMIYDPDAFEDE